MKIRANEFVNGACLAVLVASCLKGYLLSMIGFVLIICKDPDFARIPH